MHSYKTELYGQEIKYFLTVLLFNVKAIPLLYTLKKSSYGRILGR